MRNVLLPVVAAAVAVAVSPASAATSVTVTPNAAAAPMGATTTLNFNGDLATELASKGIKLVTTGTTGQFGGTTSQGTFTFVAPAGADGGFYGVGGTTPPAQVAQSIATFTSASNQAFSNISVFIGSLDAYNVVKLLYTDGTFDTYDGQQLNGGVKPGFPGGAINTRASFTATGGKQYSGVSFYNNGLDGSLEFDNLAFTAAVPEPATWAMMLVGFGMVGAASRYRRRSAKAAIA